MIMPSIKISFENRDKLSLLKIDYHLKTFSDVIDKLLKTSNLHKTFAEIGKENKALREKKALEREARALEWSTKQKKEQLKQKGEEDIF